MTESERLGGTRDRDTVRPKRKCARCRRTLFSGRDAPRRVPFRFVSSVFRLFLVRRWESETHRRGARSRTRQCSSWGRRCASRAPASKIRIRAEDIYIYIYISAPNSHRFRRGSSKTALESESFSELPVTKPTAHLPRRRKRHSACRDGAFRRKARNSCGFRSPIGTIDGSNDSHVSCGFPKHARSFPPFTSIHPVSNTRSKVGCTTARSLFRAESSRFGVYDTFPLREFRWFLRRSRVGVSARGGLARTRDDGRASLEESRRHSPSRLNRPRVAVRPREKPLVSRLSRRHLRVCCAQDARDRAQTAPAELSRVLRAQKRRVSFFKSCVFFSKATCAQDPLKK